MQKQTIAGQARIQSAPYTHQAASTSTQSLVTATAPASRVIVCRPASVDSASPSTSSCRCVNSSLDSHRGTHTVPSTSIVSSIAPTRSQTGDRSAPGVRSISATAVAGSSAANPMLLVPFAACPGFVPIQGQQPVIANMSRPPPPVGSGSMQPPASMPPIHHQQHMSQALGAAQQMQVPASSGNGPAVAVLLTPNSCSSGSVKVKPK